jgi:hypothetical protein
MEVPISVRISTHARRPREEGGSVNGGQDRQADILAVGAAGLAPHTITIPGVVIAIDIDDRADDEIEVIQEEGR